MKRIIPILPLLFLLIACKKELVEPGIKLIDEWEQLSIESNIDFTKVFFTDENTGFVAGQPAIDSIFFYDSTVIKIPDYNIWAAESHIITDASPYYDIFVSRTVPEVPPAAFFKTADGGNTWTAIKTPFVTQIIDIFFLNGHDGFVVTEKEGVFKTTDGGNNWKKILANIIFPGSTNTQQAISNPYSKVCFFNEMEGIVYNNKGKSIVIQTKDGGETWSFISNFTNSWSPRYNITNMQKLEDNNTAFFFDLSGNILKSTDKGNHWDSLPNVKLSNPYLGEFDNSNITDLYFVDEQVGYYTNAGYVYKTNNGGDNWELLSRNEADRIFGFETGKIFSAQTAAEGIVYSYENSTNGFKGILELDFQQLNDICFPSGNIGYAVGKDGLILKYSNTKN